jgi:hypothetical protein
MGAPYLAPTLRQMWETRTFTPGLPIIAMIAEKQASKIIELNLRSEDMMQTNSPH